MASCFPLHYALRCKYASAAQLCFTLSTRLSMPFWKTKAHELLCKTYLVRCRCDFFPSLCFACPAICGWNDFCCFVWRAMLKSFGCLKIVGVTDVTATPFAAPFADHHLLCLMFLDVLN